MKDAAELFARGCCCGTLQAEVILERLAQLFNAGVSPKSILEVIETHLAAKNHPGDPLAFQRLEAASSIKGSVN
ncbi:MAG TPA: hypothetical protein PLR76_12265 [Hyphomonas sp.]|nr:hypothetical protein [Hyphomonas sp.]